MLVIFHSLHNLNNWHRKRRGLAPYPPLRSTLFNRPLQPATGSCSVVWIGRAAADHPFVSKCYVWVPAALAVVALEVVTAFETACWLLEVLVMSWRLEPVVAVVADAAVLKAGRVAVQKMEMATV